jgi:hypothetical protein
MKKLINLFVIVILFQSFQCSKSDDKIANTVTPEQLLSKKQEIIDYINSFSCTENGNCNSIAFGSKPCGGPREYLVFPNSVNLPQLQQMVSEFNEMDSNYNIQTGAISDCVVVSPPNKMGCVNGVCTIIN